jgi:S1-C subfamily serine protease
LARVHQLAAKQAVEVISSDPSGPAAHAGLLPGDLVVALNERTVGSVDDMHRVLADWPIGKSLNLTVLRGKERLELEVVPSEAA